MAGATDKHTPILRRSFLAGVGAPSLLADTSAVSPAPDAVLLRLLNAWRTNIVEQHRLEDLDSSAVDDIALVLSEYHVLAAESRALDLTIAATPARSLAGLRVKIEVATYGGGCDDGAVLRSALRDICEGGPFA